MNCVAILLTKSKTKFFIEYHSSCLEKTVKTLEGENMEHLDGSIKVWFGNQVELTPIISDPEYLLDQHILICVKSTDCDESYGESCVALRAAQFNYTEFQITLTHHGEKTGTLTGGIQLRTSEGTPTEKLYDFIKVEKDDTVASKGKGCDKFSVTQTHDISNPSYMGMPYKGGKVVDQGWSYSLPQKHLPIAGEGSKDTKKGGYDVGGTRSPTGKPMGEDEKGSEMFDNPLYGVMEKSRGKDQDHRQKDLLAPSDPNISTSRPADGDPDRPPMPTPRNRSFTFSEAKPQPPTSIPLHASAHKKPVVPTRSEGGMAFNRPPLPSKSWQGMPEPHNPRDHRESSELPSKHRPPARPGQPQPQRHAS